MPSIQIEADESLAYVKIRDEKVTRSVELDDNNIIDLNEFDIIVGVEVLDIPSAATVEEVEKKVHLASADRETLKMLLSVLQRSSFSSGSLTKESRLSEPLVLGPTLESC